MRTLERNKSKFYYATYIGSTEMLDENGFNTFEPTVSYSKWKPYKANISAARGESTAELFGNDLVYDKIIVTDDTDCEIDENSVLAIDFAVEEGADVAVYDYVVVKRAESLNFVQYAVRKVKVNELPSPSNGNTGNTTGN